MSERAEYLLIGGGLAAASAAKAIRKSDPGGDLQIVAAEDELPYHRPPLSKEYLKGKAKKKMLTVQRERWYEKRDIRVRMGTQATGLDPGSRTVSLDDGGVVEYGRCLVATGGRARTLDLPGADREGVHTLRTLADSEAIGAEIEAGDRVVIVGASFIGMEVAAACAEAGLETRVLELAPRVWSRITDDRLSGFFRAYFEARGVEFFLGDGPESFEGDGRVRAVRAREAGELPADFVVVGIGIELDLELLEGTGIRVEDGVVVDEHLLTSVEGVYAAGDIASYPDPIFDKRMRVEHWDAAKAQGTVAGANMAGGEETYDHMSYFFSDVFDLSLHVAGDLEGYERTLIRGSTDDASFLAFYLKANEVRGALTVNRDWQELEAAKSLIRRHAVVEDEGRWSDPGVPLDELG